MDNTTLPLWLRMLKWSVIVLDVLLYPFYWIWFQPSTELKRRIEPKRVQVTRISENEGTLFLVI